jgi:hypothetical protein
MAEMCVIFRNPRMPAANPERSDVPVKDPSSAGTCGVVQGSAGHRGSRSHWGSGGAEGSERERERERNHTENHRRRILKLHWFESLSFPGDPVYTTNDAFQKLFGDTDRLEHAGQEANTRPPNERWAVLARSKLPFSFSKYNL